MMVKRQFDNEYGRRIDIEATRLANRHLFVEIKSDKSRTTLDITEVEGRELSEAIASLLKATP